LTSRRITLVSARRTVVATGDRHGPISGLAGEVEDERAAEQDARGMKLAELLEALGLAFLEN